MARDNRATTTLRPDRSPSGAAVGVAGAVTSSPGISIGVRSPITLAVTVLLLAATLRLGLSAIVPLIDPTEGRYAQIAWEMVQSGDWVTPRIVLDTEPVPYLGKPPLFFWTAAASMTVFGRTELAARWPSFAATGLLLVLMWIALGRALGRGAAARAVVITGSCLLVFGAAGTATIDPLLALFVAGALFGQLALLREGDPRFRRRWSLLVFLLLAGGFLTKGPVALVLFGLPVAGFMLVRRSWEPLGRHAWWSGLALFVLLVAPWYLSAELRNPGFLRYFFVNENLLRYLTPHYGDQFGTGHQYVRGSAAVFFVLASLPWAPLAAWRLVRKGRRRLRRSLEDDGALLLLLGFTTMVGFWCCARQLLPTYLLPSIPLFAAWAGLVVFDDRSELPRLSRIAGGAAVLWLVAVTAFAVVEATGSARGVIASARARASNRNPPVHVVFAGRTPFSAWFYGADLVVGHPREPVAASLTRAASFSPPALVALRAQDRELVPESQRSRLPPVATGDHWLVLDDPILGGRASLGGSGAVR